MVRASVFALTLGVLAVPSAARASNETALQCAEQSERAQKLRDEGKLREARALFLACAAERCPSIISRDCTTWYLEIDARQPTVVISAKDASGRDLTDVKVFVDDAPVAEKLDASVLPLDPGEHVFRFEAPGRVPAESKLLLRDGEKRRVVSVVLEARGAESVKAPAPAAPATARPLPWLALGLGGVALAGAGTFAYFFSSAVDRRDELARTCAPSCAEQEVDAARTKVIIADVALGVGIAAAVGAVVAYVLTPTESKPSPAEGKPSAAEALLRGAVRF